jgi:hypothetical protein
MSLQHSPSSEADSSSASLEIPQFIQNLKVHYSSHNSLPLVPIMSKIQLVHAHPPPFPL